MFTFVFAVLALALIAVLFLRTPSTFLFDLIESAFTHDHPTRR